MEQTAADAYGFTSYTPAYPGGLVVAPQTDQADGIPAVALPKLGMGHQNPLFWLLILGLVFVGYLSLGFNVNLKKIGRLGGKLGR